MPKAPVKTKEGRVNVPLYEKKSQLDEIAEKEGTTSTNLARILILDGLNRIASGEARFRGPAVEPIHPA